MSEVKVKALEWSRENIDGTFWIGCAPVAGFGEYRVKFNGTKWECIRGVVLHSEHGTSNAAKAAAQADYETRILSAIEPSPHKGEAAKLEDQWRDLALQFDGHRIEALSLLRYVSEADTALEAIGRMGEIRAFLAKPPLAGEAVLAQRISEFQQVEIERLGAERDALEQQAVQWKGEAMAHKSSLHEAYQVLTGATGEPANWNGARPFKQFFEEDRHAFVISLRAWVKSRYGKVITHMTARDAYRAFHAERGELMRETLANTSILRALSPPESEHE